MMSVMIYRGIYTVVIVGFMTFVSMAAFPPIDPIKQVAASLMWFGGGFLVADTWLRRS